MSNKQNLSLNSEQVINTETTGLAAFQLVSLEQTMKEASLAYSNNEDQKAEKYCRRALQIYPDFALPLTMLGMLARKYNNFPAAEIFLKKALDILPGIADRWAIYSLVLKQLGKFEDALNAIEQAVQLNPVSIAAVNNKASILNILGRESEALELYESLMRSAPQYGKPFHNFARAHKFSKEGEINTLFEKLERDHKAFAKYDDRMNAHFALGNYFEGIGNYEKGFQHFLEANNLLRSKVNYDVQQDIDQIDSVKSKFAVPIHSEGISRKGENIVFVLGMPRSGTTLVEQVLASHPEISGAGEVETFGQLCQSFNRSNQVVKSLSETEVFRGAKQYLSHMESLSDGARLVVDKMPHNFLHIGYINLTLPKAKIIHCRRNPIDTCLSIFRLQFENKLYFSSDLSELGQYYVAYDNLMKHWMKLFPEKILEVHYEEVVNNIEKQARSMIDHIGVEWDQSCLDFHKHERAVHTASTGQVRQPIYKGAVGRYEKYGDLLEPLLEALEPVL